VTPPSPSTTSPRRPSAARHNHDQRRRWHHQRHCYLQPVIQRQLQRRRHQLHPGLRQSLPLGTNPVVCIVADTSGNTQTCQFDVVVQNLPSTPLSVSAPTLTNALLTSQNVYVVVPGATNVFDVSATGPAGQPLSYQWPIWGQCDQQRVSPERRPHVYATTNCGPVTASVTVTAGGVSITSNLTVAVACPLSVTKFQAKLNFAKPNNDTCGLTAIAALRAGFLPAGQTLTLDIGVFKRHSCSTAEGKGRMPRNLPARVQQSDANKTRWLDRTVKLSHGSFASAWADDGLTDATTPHTGVAVSLPVALVVGDEALVTDKILLYTATADKSGSAK